MKIIKIIYNKDTKFIVDLVKSLGHNIYIESFNLDNRKDMKQAYSILTRFGTRQVPLLVFEDENLQEYNAIWSERKPNWEEEINKILVNE